MHGAVGEKAVVVEDEEIDDVLTEVEDSSV